MKILPIIKMTEQELHDSKACGEVLLRIREMSQISGKELNCAEMRALIVDIWAETGLVWFAVQRITQ